MKKKHIYILATGGTISAQGEEGKTLNYTNGIFKIDSILETVKGIDKIAKISKEQIFNISSDFYDFTNSDSQTFWNNIFDFRNKSNEVVTDNKLSWFVSFSCTMV